MAQQLIGGGQPQVQLPFMQIPPAAGWQVVPQVPQLSGSVLKLTHLGGVPQAVIEIGQAHLPETQTWPPLHTTPQAPQLLLPRGR
jgi:hypothetical protein